MGLFGSFFSLLAFAAFNMTSLGLANVAWYIFAAAVVTTIVEAQDDMRRAKNQAREAYNASLRDRLEMVDVSADQARTVVMGRVRCVEGVRRRWVSGANNQRLTMVVSFAGHEIDGFEQFYFDDVALTLDGSGYVATEPYAKQNLVSAYKSVTLDGSGAAVVVLDYVPAAGTSVAAVIRGGSGTEIFEQSCTVSMSGSTATITGGLPGSGATVSYQYNSPIKTARIRTYTGAPGQNVGAALASEYPGKITANDRFDGMAVAVVDIDYDPDVYTSGRPNVTAVLRGARVYDPRKDGTQPGGSGAQRLATPATWEFSENPALHAYHFARAPVGWAVPASEVSAADVMAAADACDIATTLTLRKPDNSTEQVTLPRHRCGIVISTDGDRRSSMDEIMKTMGGRHGWAGGMLRIRAATMRASSFELDASWIAQLLNEDGEPANSDEPVLRLTNGVARENRVTRVTGKCVNPAERWQPLPFPAIQDQVLIAADGGIPMPLEVTFDGVNHPAHAQHLASMMIRQGQAALRMQAQCNLNAFRCELFDVGQITLDRFGMAAKTFEVIGWRWHAGEGVQLSLSEISDAMFVPMAELRGVDPAPNSNLPPPWSVQDIYGLAVTSGTPDLTDPKSPITRTGVSWTAVTQGSVLIGGQVEVQYIEHGDLASEDWSSWIEAGSSVSATIPGLLAGRYYVFRARAIQAMPIVRGKWSAQVVAQISTPAAPVRALRLQASAQVVKVDAGGALTPASITFTVYGGAAGSPSFSATGGAVLTGSGLTRAMDTATISGASTTVQVSWGGETDTVTVVKVVDGVDGAAGSKGDKGDAGSPGADGTPGVPGTSPNKIATAYLYQWTSGTPGDPSGASTYTWASGASSSYSGGNGWQASVPANPGTPGVALWAASKAVSDVQAAATTSVSWSSGFAKYAWSQNGAAGAPGVKTAVASVYRWEPTIPGAPIGSPTYTWATASFGAAPSSWALTPGSSPSPGYTLWAAEVTLVESGGAATTGFNWSSASVVARGYAGSAGTAGASARIAYAVVSSASTPSASPNPATVSGDNRPAYNTWGMGETWQATVPAYGAGQTVYQTDGIYSPSTGNTVWSLPYISALKVGSLSAISVNTGSLTANGDISVSGKLLGGAFAGFAWPASGQTGFYLGPSGLLIGNGNDGKYVQINASGDLYAPGFSIVSGASTFWGTLTVGSSPAVSGTTMSGWGAVFNPNGTFAIGNATTNISFNGGAIVLNGQVVASSNVGSSAITTQASGTFAGVGSNVETTASKTSSCTIGSITTSATGDGRVMLLLSPLGKAADPNDYTQTYVGKMWVTGNGYNTNFKWRVKRNGTTIRERSVDYNTGGGTPALIDMPTIVFDTPGAGVACTYTYEMVETNASATGMRHEILDSAFVLLELKR